MFNLSGSEIVFLLLIALIVLGPEKLPDAVRRFGKMYAEFKKMSTGFQSELKTALDEPMREMRETAEAIKKAADFEFNADLDTTTGVESSNGVVEHADEAVAKPKPEVDAAPEPEVDAAPAAAPAESAPESAPTASASSPAPVNLDDYDEPSYGSNIVEAVDESRTE